MKTAEHFLGVEFCRDWATEGIDSLGFIAESCDAWLYSVYSSFGTTFGFGKADRLLSFVFHLFWLYITHMKLISSVYQVSRKEMVFVGSYEPFFYFVGSIDFT